MIASRPSRSVLSPPTVEISRLHSLEIGAIKVGAVNGGLLRGNHKTNTKYLKVNSLNGDRFLVSLF
jgi:hypothetical protein